MARPKKQTASKNDTAENRPGSGAAGRTVRRRRESGGSSPSQARTGNSRQTKHRQTAHEKTPPSHPKAIQRGRNREEAATDVCNSD
jgi:hypothetical protein